jgi:hypothetical protein
MVRLNFNHKMDDLCRHSAGQQGGSFALVRLTAVVGTRSSCPCPDAGWWGGVSGHLCRITHGRVEYLPRSG